MFTILHLSDLHFGAHHHFRQNPNDPAAPTLADAVTRALEARNDPLKFDALLLSGDFFSNNPPGELYFARDMCQELIGRLKVPEKRILCVPGNHDLTWDEQFKQAPFRFY